MTDVPMDPIAIDVGSLVQRTVTSLYSHLVTRPTGRAVRMAIETQLTGVGQQSLSLIDLSEVSILDFSCADEVVAKLLQRYVAGGAHEAFFVFRGVTEVHLDQVQTVLERQQLAAVAETAVGNFEVLGVVDENDLAAWSTLEKSGLLTQAEIELLFPGQASAADRFHRLAERRLVFRSPASGRYHALSRLVEHLL